MNPTKALNEFWSSFGLPTYDEASVPTGENAPKFPYITYQVATGDFGEPIFLSASVWYRSTSWIEANSKAQEISTRISRGGCMIACESGGIWITKGSPFAQSMGDPSDNMIKRKIINISAEFIMAD